MFITSAADFPLLGYIWLLLYYSSGCWVKKWATFGLRNGLVNSAGQRTNDALLNLCFIISHLSLACPASTPSSLAFALRHPIASRRPLDELMAGNPTQQCRVSPKLCHFQGVGCISDGNGCLKGSWIVAGTASTRKFFGRNM